VNNVSGAWDVVGAIAFNIATIEPQTEDPMDDLRPVWPVIAVSN
jgi:hypothetical protein